METQFDINDVIKVIIPKSTIDLLKAQKNDKTSDQKGKKKSAKATSKPSSSTKDSTFDPMQCQYYVFQLVWKDTTIEYVTEGYLPFKYITAAFEDLINQKDIMSKVNKRITIFSQQIQINEQIE